MGIMATNQETESTESFREHGISKYRATMQSVEERIRELKATLNRSVDAKDDKYVGF
jgi:hypothetical protein